MSVDLSIIIVNWNTRDLLANCLASLEAACPGLSFEILVVDNASSDGSAEMIAEAANDLPTCRLMESGGNLGFTRANNLALEQTSGDFILLLNPDTVCPPGSLTRLVEFASIKSSLGAVGPLLVDEQGLPTITYGYFPSAHFHWLGFLDPLRLLPGRWFQNRVVHIPARTETSDRVDYVLGACFLMPRSALESVGKLDEQFFMYFEETDWCHRARRRGLDIWYCAEVEITHLEGRSAEKAGRFTTRQFQKSYRLFIGKHYGPGQIPGFRLAQAAEYGLKALFRLVAPGDRRRNLALARTYRERFRLQFQGQIQAVPPDLTSDVENRRG
ncbi:MAG: glycosyltransferase family 2 protein [Gemmatimonadales bacterium]|nr:glycosyltransferase family 2 protein [Gemmatimonadales bacterium]